MMRIELIVLGLGCVCMSSLARDVEMVTTTSSDRWQDQKVKVLKGQAVQTDYYVYTDSLMQKVDGMGGTFNELGWDALQCLNEKDRTEVMRSLFSDEGINFAFGRTPIASSDYAFAYYSYDDVKDDYEMRNFSIGRDRYTLIPYIKEALKIRPDLRLWASPWCPPTWMKINEHYSLKSQGVNKNGDGHNRLDPRRATFIHTTGFNMQVGYLEAYALYFSKYIKEYKKNGVNISMVMPQNEIAWQPAWPSCTWRPEDLAIFVGKYLGPQFKKDSLDTEIWLGTINFPNPDYVRTFLEDKDATSYIKGIGIQWTGKKALPTIAKEYPQYTYMQTENECGDGENNWSSLERTWKAIVHCFNHGVSSYMYWNMVLDETGKSSWDWSQNSLVRINRQTKKVDYTDEYYLMKHISHFVQPGSCRLKVSKEDNMLAFLNHEGKVVVVVYNPEKKSVTSTLQVGDKKIEYVLQPLSIATLVCDK